jgi:hypothetical protein
MTFIFAGIPGGLALSDHRLSGLAPQRAVVAAGADALNGDASEQ